MRHFTLTAFLLTADLHCERLSKLTPNLLKDTHERYLEVKSETNISTEEEIDIYDMSRYNFKRTFEVESHNKYDMVNRNDLGSMALGIVQFREIYCKRLSKALGIKSWMSTKEIQRRLRTEQSKELQLKMFYEQFVIPTLDFALEQGITDATIIEFMVDWRVNGITDKYYKQINQHTTLKQLVTLRNSRYHNIYKYDKKLVRLGRRSRPKYTKRILNHWLKRSNSFLV